MKYCSFLIFKSCLFVSTFVFSQSASLKLVAEVPVQVGLGYEGKLSNRLSLSLQGGILAEPNTTIILNTMEALGTDEEIIWMIQHTFSLGFVAETGINYNFKRNYIGAFFQAVILHGGNTSAELVEDYFNEDISSYPQRLGRFVQDEKYLTLTSTLYQAGLQYGHRFPLNNKHFEIDAEASLSANVGSHSTLSSRTRQLSALSAEVDKELSYYYSNYAFVPGIAVILVYKFDTQDKLR